MDFVTGLLLFADYKRDSYDSILVIVKRLTKMVNYEPIKVIIHALGLVKVIINVVVQYHSLPNSIINNQGSIFYFKFWSLLCYIFDIKKQLSTAFYPQTDEQTERPNSTIEVYLCTFINWE